MVIGLTGGIGSGKTLVSSMFKDLGVPIYISDLEAKKIMTSQPQVIKAIKQLFGNKAYSETGDLNRKFIASQVFLDKKKLNNLNAIVHPAVAIDFKKWQALQEAKFVIKESAILFETNGARNCDLIILVTAPKEIRIKRVIQRDKTTLEGVKNRIDNQWDDSRKIELSDYIISNIDLVETKKKVNEIHKSITAMFD